MNSCNFVGVMQDDPVLLQERGASVVRFFVVIEELRKSRKEKKKMYNVLAFEAWDTGAEAICASCQAGQTISIESSARFDKNTEETYFRVNTFKVF